MTAIEPDLEAYGRYARASAIADWLEVAAWKGRRMTRAQLEELFFDNNWTTKYPQQFITAEDIAESDDHDDPEFQSNVPELWSEAILAVLQERADILGEKWPFEIKGNWRVVPTAAIDTYPPYLFLLCVTVCHSWNLSTTDRPTILIEDTVSRALQAKGWSVVSMGTADRASRSFQENLTATASACGLTAMNPAFPAKAHAKDAGVDTLAHLGWSDHRRAGQWITLGQVTIAKSERWEAKIQEPRKDHWADYFYQPLHPFRFLAVPHHVERQHVEHLVGETTGMLIDRLRLALDLPELTDAERRMVDEISQVPIDDGRHAA